MVILSNVKTELYKNAKRFQQLLTSRWLPHEHYFKLIFMSLQIL